MTDPLADLPPLPTLGAVSRRPPPSGARRAWVRATVEAVRPETPTAMTVRLALPPGSEAHTPGQHYVVRRPREDGSWAQRSYSVASAPERGVGPGAARHIDLGVELLEGGELSPYLHRVRPGDKVELRGPFGGWFLWRDDGPALLVAGGSGLVPVMSMLRDWRAGTREHGLHLVVSVRTPQDLYYRDELTGPRAGPEVTVVHTRRAPDDGPPARRLNADVLRPLLIPAAAVFVCGSAGFAEHAGALLVDLGVPTADIRVERFGPS